MIHKGFKHKRCKCHICAKDIPNNSYPQHIRDWHKMNRIDPMADPRKFGGCIHGAFDWCEQGCYDKLGVIR